MSNKNANPTQTVKRFIITDPTDDTFYTQMDNAQWTPNITHAKLFWTRFVAEQVNAELLYGHGNVRPVQVSYQYQD